MTVLTTAISQCGPENIIIAETGAEQMHVINNPENSQLIKEEECRATESLNINMKRWTTSKPLLPDVGNINEHLLSAGIFICRLATERQSCLIEVVNFHFSTPPHTKPKLLFVSARN